MELVGRAIDLTREPDFELSVYDGPAETVEHEGQEYVVPVISLKEFFSAGNAYMELMKAISENGGTKDI